MATTKKEPTITAAPRGDGIDLDAVIQKRLKGDPFADSALAIPLREPGRWATYVANSETSPDRHYDMVARKGWTPLTVDDLPVGVTAQAVGWNVAEDGQTLCRGARGQEVLYKQPIEVNIAIAKAKAAQNMKGMGSAAKVKADMTNALAAQAGDEAGTFADQNIHLTGGDRVGPLGA